MDSIEAIRTALGPEGFTAYCRGTAIAALNAQDYETAIYYTQLANGESAQCDQYGTPPDGTEPIRCGRIADHGGEHVVSTVGTGRFTWPQYCTSRSPDGRQCRELSGHEGQHGDGFFGGWNDTPAPIPPPVPLPEQCAATYENPGGSYRCIGIHEHQGPHSNGYGPSRYQWDDLLAPPPRTCGHFSERHQLVCNQQYGHDGNHEHGLNYWKD